MNEVRDVLAHHDLHCVDLESDDVRWHAALPVLQELRPHLSVSLLRQVQTGTGAPTFSALLTDREECVSVAGWRVQQTTANPTGRRLHVDDLVTARAYRGQGYGSVLLTRIEARAHELGCGLLELDSGVQRHSAHQFYQGRGMTVTCHHFGKQLA